MTVQGILTAKTTHGALTAKMGKWLGKELVPRGYDVFYDHGDPADPNVGEIVSSVDEAPARGEELSQLDIAILEKTTNRIVALIEIEDKSDTPKTFLGDIFGILMGRSIAFKDKSKDWNIGNWTTLIVFGKREDAKPKHIGHILDNVEKVRSNLSTANSKIGKVDIKSFADEAELTKLLQDLTSSF